MILIIFLVFVTTIVIIVVVVVVVLVIVLQITKKERTFTQRLSCGSKRFKDIVKQSYK